MIYKASNTTIMKNSFLLAMGRLRTSVAITRPTAETRPTNPDNQITGLPTKYRYLASPFSVSHRYLIVLFSKGQVQGRLPLASVFGTPASYRALYDKLSLKTIGKYKGSALCLSARICPYTLDAA